jgi:protein-tyrosine phosphatase
VADERAAGEGAGLEFLSFPIKDRGLPSDAEAVSRFSKRAHARITSGCGLVFHCRAGIGRSGMMAASVLLHQGLTVREAFARISAARGLMVPDTPGQLEWIESNYAMLIGTT